MPNPRLIEGGTGPPAAPSLAAVRVRLLQEKLATQSGRSSVLPRVVATGRTGAGKSTLGNLLVGIDHVLRSDGPLDCTSEVNVVRFPLGLEYVDLPGVASDEMFENVNRVALGMPQVARWPHADAIAVKIHEVRCRHDDGVEARPLVSETTHRADEAPVTQIRPDLILYLVAPHRLLDRDELAYLTELVRHYGSHRIVHVLNIFTNRGTGTVAAATPENLIEARRRIAEAHAAAGGDIENIRSIEVNCLDGEGVDKLIALCGDSLDGEQGGLFADILSHQQRHAPDAFAEEAKQFVAARGLAVLFDVPKSDESVGALLEDRTAELMAVVPAGIPLRDRFHYPADHAEMVTRVVESVRQEIVEPVFEEKTNPAYESVPIYDTVEETDYDNPIYEDRPVYEWRDEYESPDDVVEFGEAVLNAMFGDGYGVRRRRKVCTGYERVRVGYGRISRRVVVSYDRRHSHTERWQEQVGQRVVDVTYRPLGVWGVALLLVVFRARVLELSDADKARRRPLTKDYERALRILQRCSNPDGSLAENALVDRLDDLLGADFDAALRRLAASRQGRS